MQLLLMSNAAQNKLGEKKVPLKNTSNLKISVFFSSYFSVVTSVQHYYKSVILFLQCDNLNVN